MASPTSRRASGPEAALERVRPRSRPGRAAQSTESPLDALAGPAGKTATLVGAGGCGMRGVASFLLESGWQVWGADAAGFASNDPLIVAGMRPLEAGSEAPTVSLAIRSAAVPYADSSWQQARGCANRSLLYSEMLGEISRLRPVLAVAGSHGKSTCTAWLAWALREAGVDVGYLVGAPVPQLGSSSAWGDPQLPLILESCEYARSFHHLRPARVALLNVDAEHPDTYPGGLPEVEAAFRYFLSRVTDGGQVDAGPEAPHWEAECGGRWLPAASLPDDWAVGIPGKHNRLNGALVAAVLRSFELSEAQVRHGIAGFQGAGRRFEELGSWNGATLVSDYAHHPVEIAATLQAARERWPNRRLHVVFQPHQALRLHAYRDQFAPSLDEADALLLLEVFRARDPEGLQASAEELIPALQQRKPDRSLQMAKDFAAARRKLEAELHDDDVVLFLGAGDVDRFARRIR